MDLSDFFRRRLAHEDEGAQRFSSATMSLPITSATTGKKVLVATFDLPAPFSSGVASELQVVDCAGGVEGAQFCPAHSPAAGGAAVMRADSSNCGCGRGYR